MIDRLRPRLTTYRDDAGRRLIDLADARLPQHERFLPPRFLPAFDNAVLGYHDRRRVIDDEHRGLSVAGARLLLVGGRVAGTWAASPGADGVQVSIDLLSPVPADDQDAVREEGHRLAAFLGDGVPGAVALTGP